MEHRRALRNTLGCPTAGSVPGMLSTGIVFFPLVPSTAAPMPPPGARAALLCCCAGLVLQVVSREKKANTNSNYILGTLGPWGGRGSYKISATWLNLAVFISQQRHASEAGYVTGYMGLGMRFSKVSIWSVQAEQSNTQTHSNTWPIVFTSEWKDFRYYPKPSSNCQEILLSPGNTEQNQTLAKLLSLLGALGFTTIPKSCVLTCVVNNHQ